MLANRVWEGVGGRFVEYRLMPYRVIAALSRFFRDE
jgi:hypothetical protein